MSAPEEPGASREDEPRQTHEEQQMPTGRPVTAEQRARAEALMVEGRLGRNAIAREIGISAGAVSKIAQEVGHTFDWRSTEIATAARKIELGAMRAALAQAALLRAGEALEAMSAPHEEVHFSAATEHSKGGWRTYLHPVPSPSDQRNYATTFGILVQRAAELMKASEGGGVSGQAASVLDGLASGLAEVASRLRAEEPDSDPTADPEKLDREGMIADLEAQIEAAGGEDEDDDLEA